MIPMDMLVQHLRSSLLINLPRFMGIQEASNLINSWANTYPDLIKETLRVIPPQKLTELMKRLLKEGIPIRNLRDLFEIVTDKGSREKDLDNLLELVRQGMKYQLSDLYANNGNKINAILFAPDFEDSIRESIRNHPDISTSQQLYDRISSQLYDLLSQNLERDSRSVLLCGADIRSPLRISLEEDFRLLPVVAYQELVGSVQIVPVGQIR
jgi:type III secretion protein V